MNPLLKEILFNRYTAMLAVVLSCIIALVGLRTCACVTQSANKVEHDEKTTELDLPSRSDYDSRKLQERSGPDQSGKKRPVQ